MRPLAVLAACLAALGAEPALAASSDWVEIGPGSRVRLVADGMLTAEGRARLGLEIELAAGTRTYWRVPGEAGLPLDLDLSESDGVHAAEIAWPYPEREYRGGVLEYVYFDAVLIPISVTPAPGAASLTVRADVILGVCSDICIPAQAEFELPVEFGAPDRAAAFRIDSALAEVPIAAPVGEAPFGAVRAGSGGLSVEADAGAALASLIVDAGPGPWIFGPPQIGPVSGLFTVPVLAGGEASELVGVPVRLTYMTESGPFELIRVVGPAGTVDSAAKVE